MKKIIGLVLSVCLVAVCSFLVAPMFNESTQVSAATPAEIEAGANEARFLNMLNHNFVYNTDFDNIDTIVNNSVLNLLSLRDIENEDFIDETYVKGFVKDMYGIEIADMSGFNAEFPQLDGFVYIIPRGFTSYNHEIVSVVENEDGSFTVTSEVTADAHDGEAETKTAVSLFVENEESAFGYNMIYCDIIENANYI